MFRKSFVALALGAGVLSGGAAGVAAAAGGVGGAVAGASQPMCGSLATAPTYKHVIWILEENNSYGSIVGSSKAPYINSVIKACGLASNYHNISHASLDNYIGLTNGYTLTQLKPYLNDCTPGTGCTVTTGSNIFKQVALKPGGWKAYAESMPSACDKSDSGNYYVKHNPAAYYSNLALSCSHRDLSLGTLSSSPLIKAFQSETTAPAFTFVTPNICDDMHGALQCLFNLVQSGDSWLKSWLPAITATPVYQSNDTAIVIVWDEGAFGSTGEDCHANTSDQSCHVAAVVVAPSVKPGTNVTTLLNHYSLLKTTEDLLGVPELGMAAQATSMASGFNL